MANNTTTEPYQLNWKEQYPFVPSTAEHNRLEQQSTALNELMLNKPFRSPIKSPLRILDIGCGTGIQTLILAKQYPQATIIGIDKSPVPDIHAKPDNVIYLLGELDDLIESKHELLQPESFDFIYQRMFIMCVNSWPQHIANLKALLKPGGYFESQEMDQYNNLYDKDENSITERFQYPQVFIRTVAKHYKADLTLPPRLPEIFEEEGFEDVRLDKFPLAFRGGWKEKPEAEAWGVYVNWASRPFYRHVLEVGAEDEGVDPEVFMREYEDEVLNGEVGIHGNFMVTTGKKV